MCSSDLFSEEAALQAESLTRVALENRGYQVTGGTERRDWALERHARRFGSAGKRTS